MRTPLFVLFFSTLFFVTKGQQTGKVDYPFLGVSFQIPNQWLGQESEDLYMMASNTIPGIILMLPHEEKYTLTDLETLAHQGIQDGYSTNLKLSGDLQKYGKNAVGGEFEGVLDGQNVKAYLIGTLNPYGKGATILATTTVDQYSSKYKEYALAVYNSLKFSEPDTKGLEQEWHSYLSGTRLTYMNSYYDSSYSSDGITGGGYSSESTYDLCPEGYFNYNSSNSTTFGSDNSSMYSSSQDKGSGTWSIEIGAGGSVTLVLNYYSGEVFHGELKYEDSKLYMNGTRYFRTNSGEYAPNCN